MNKVREDYFELWNDFTSIRGLLSEKLVYTDEYSKFVFIFWARINSLCDELMFLIKADKYSSVNILLRSVLESFVDLKCLVSDESYLDKVKSAEIESEYKNLKYYSERNPYFSGVTPVSLEALEIMKGAKGLRLFDRFSKIDDGEKVYRTVYNYLCRFTHGNITALASRNFECNKIVIGSEKVEIAELKFFLSMTINFAIASTLEAGRFINLDVSEVEALLERSHSISS